MKGSSKRIKSALAVLVAVTAACFLISRSTYVAANWEYYGAYPGEILKVWRGGWGMPGWPSPALGKTDPQPLPDLALQTLDGKAVRLSQYRGRPVVINLWAAWCPPCRSEMPALALLEKKYPGTAFLYINQGEDAATIADYLAEEKLALGNVIRDPLNSAWRHFDAEAIPTTLFYNAEGSLLGRYTGELSYPQLQSVLARLE